MKLAVGAFASLYGYQEKNFMLAFNNPGQYCNGEMVAVRVGVNRSTCIEVWLGNSYWESVSRKDRKSLSFRSVFEEITVPRV